MSGGSVTAVSGGSVVSVTVVTLALVSIVSVGKPVPVTKEVREADTCCRVSSVGGVHSAICYSVSAFSGVNSAVCYSVSSFTSFSSITSTDIIYSLLPSVVQFGCESCGIKTRESGG